MSLTTAATTTSTKPTPDKKMGASTFSNQDLVSMGNAANYLSMVMNVLVTLAVLFGFPSADVFDDSWRKDGQCYTSHNLFDVTMDTSTLCCILLCASSAIVWMQWYRHRGTTMNDYLVDQLPKIVQSNVSHGLGHYFVHLIGGSIPRVRPLSLAPVDIGYTLVLVVFWPATLRTAMPQLPTIAALGVGIALIAFQAAIDIEPHLQFAFTQAVVLFVRSMVLLTTMSSQEKLANPWTYLSMGVYYLPLFPMMWLETTQCTAWVADAGGHAIYDLYLSVASIALAVCIPYIEPRKSAPSADPSSLKKTL